MILLQTLIKLHNYVCTRCLRIHRNNQSKSTSSKLYSKTIQYKDSLSANHANFFILILSERHKGTVPCHSFSTQYLPNIWALLSPLKTLQGPPLPWRVINTGRQFTSSTGLFLLRSPEFSSRSNLHFWVKLWLGYA